MIHVREISAFTSDPSGGNPAGVVTRGAENLAARQMQAIAREMNLSETSFLLPPRRPGADVGIRWFTPTQEVSLCGHATVAAFHAAAEDGDWGLAGPGTHRIRLETLSGLLPIEVITKPGLPARIRMGLPDPEPVPFGEIAPFLEAAGLRADQLDAGLPALRSGMYVLLAVRRLESLRDVRPDMSALAAAVAELGGPDGVILSCLETLEPSSAVHIRMFAPGAGIDEDPVTGSAQAPVAGWLARIGFFSRKDAGREGRFREAGAGRVAYTAEQGDFLGRRGRVDVDLTLAGGRDAASARDVVISGRAVTVRELEMRIPRA